MNKIYNAHKCDIILRVKRCIYVPLNKWERVWDLWHNL
ncbi:hypothetical protein BMW23_0949 [Bodo saltans virus]|uniref:Uncharacterized protein n=1 Tax=Bodo saltans virus TaxID=2024608 RepID=A0A2H4UVT7_9VIRU|nr:hypothetical protein QJ851_gp0931 [Bodo saltans virus]ATZ80994.1 hypothetical protein BMW23_0949 [Bodo saltans virus]